MVNGSLQSELSRFFQVVKNKPITSEGVTPAAFCKARKKFSFTAFKALNNCLTEILYKSKSVSLWNGFRLLAVDGSVVVLPESDELYEHFGKSRDLSSHPSARLSQLYDVSNNISVDVQVAPHSVGERTMALRHLEHAREGDLILYDRGYPAVWLFILHQQKNVDFCARVIEDGSNVYKEFANSNKPEATVTLPCIEKSLRKCKVLGLPTSPIKIRLVRVDLGNGNYEILATSLRDRRQFPRKIFKDLYHQRWFVEEDYKLMKSRLEMENFTGLSAEAIMQDIHAKVLTKNLAAVAILEAEVIAREKYKGRQHKYRINFSYALSQLKDNIIRFSLCLADTDLTALLIKQIAKAVDAVRPDRKFVREKDRMRKRIKRHYISYKRVG